MLSNPYRTRLLWPAAFLLAFVMGVFIPRLLCAQTGTQTYSNVPIEQVLEDAAKKVANARAKHFHIYSPRHFDKAEASLNESKSLWERRREAEIIRVRLQTCFDELDEAANTERVVREKLGPCVAEREAALLVGAPDVKKVAWDRAEEKLFPAVRDIERGVESIPEGEIQEIAGAYRVVRREALREQIIGEARTTIALIEKAGAEKSCPTILGRAHQAIGRAEAALAQENLDDARDEANNATGYAEQARAFMDWVAQAQRDKAAYESALLPYLDLIKAAGERLGADVDLTLPPDELKDAFINLIEAREESLSTQASALLEQNESLQQSLQEAQTSLADAMAKISQLEQRTQTLETQRTESQGELQKKQQMLQTIAQAQEKFKPGEATVLQDEQGRVVVRIYGLNFAAGKSTLDKTQLKLIDRTAQAVQLFPGAAIRIEGHTDSDGGDEANRTLSEERALEVGAALADAMHIRADQLTAAGFGESQPIADNSTKEGKARNRRIDVVLTLP